MQENVVSSLRKKNFTKSEINCTLIHPFLMLHFSSSIYTTAHSCIFGFKSSIFFLFFY